MKILYIECSSPFWLAAAGQLRDLHGWQPIYWTGSWEYAPLVAQHFPQAIFHDNYPAARGLPAPALAHLAAAPVDAALLRVLAPYEHTALYMMNRMDPGGFTYVERQQHYHRLIGYWSAVLDALQPDVFIAPGVPHLVYDYVLYRLCLLRGIRTAMIQYTAFPWLIYPIAQFEEGSPALRARYAALLAQPPAQAQLSPEVEELLARARRSYAEAIPFYTRQAFRALGFKMAGVTDDDAPNPALSVASTTLRRLLSVRRYHRYWGKLRQRLRLAIQKHYPAPPPSYLKHPGQPISYRHRWSRLAWNIYRQQRFAQNRALRRHYAAMCQPVDLDAPFVFVALGYEPEASNCPEGLRYCDQPLMVALLAQTLPPGWRLYVKEHMGTLFYCDPNHGVARTPAYYDALAALPQVHLIPVETPSFNLIDRARAVATLTGSVGWEAIQRGVPALIFGTAWYRDCDGVFRIQTADDCRAAFEAIQQGARPDYARLRLFVQALEEEAVRGHTEPTYALHAGISEADNVAALVEAYVRAVADRQPDVAPAIPVQGGA